MEVFASIQGEGRYVGEPQVFVRLAGCPLRCRWCDTPGSWRVARQPSARVAVPGAARREDGWATPFGVACWVAAVEPGLPRSVSVTGGEPLLWPEFVRALQPLIAPRRLHLETAGAHPRALSRVLDACSHVSMDLKLFADLDAPEEVTLPEGPHGDALGADGDEAPEATSLDEPEAAPRDEEDWARVRARSLKLIADRDACLKLIVAGGRAPSDFEELVLDHARLARALPLFVQPATAVGDVAAPTAELLESVAELAREHDLAVRVVPQVHRFLGVP